MKYFLYFAHELNVLSHTCITLLKPTEELIILHVEIDRHTVVLKNSPYNFSFPISDFYFSSFYFFFPSFLFVYFLFFFPPTPLCAILNNRRLGKTFSYVQVKRTLVDYITIECRKTTASSWAHNFYQLRIAKTPTMVK